MALAGCGGGGGGGAAGGGLPPIIGRPPVGGGGGGPGGVHETGEYNVNYGLRAINAATAYAAGAAGQGVKVAVIDSGVDVDHPDLVGAIDAASTDVVARPTPSVDDVGGHGTWVANVLAGRKNDALAHGVAYQSTILAVRADTEGSCADRCSFQHTDLAAATDYAVANGAHILNYSLGGSSGIGGGFYAALTNAAANDRILVMAAGNSAGTDPLDPASFAATADAAGKAIAVGAVDESGQIASFSNRAGSVKDHFLVAPGVRIVTSGIGGGLATVNGTSFSAPHVAGAAAVVLSASPFLTSRQVVDLLLTTATDLGTPGTDEVYGRGMVNLAAALGPQGQLVVPAGDTVAAGGAEAEATSLRLGAAFGDGLSRIKGLGEAIFLDSYQRPYALDLARLIAAPSAAPDLEALLSPAWDRQTQGFSVGNAASLHLSTIEPRRVAVAEQPGEPDGRRMERMMLSMQPASGTAVSLSRGVGLAAQMGVADQTPFLARDAAAAPYLRLAGEGDALVVEESLGGGRTARFGFTSGGSEDDDSHRRVVAAELSQTWRGVRLGLQLGGLTERGSLLDANGDGGFDAGRAARTTFAGLTAATPLWGGYTLFGGYTRGWTEAPGEPTALLRDWQGIESDAMNAGVARNGLFDADDRLGVSLARPLKVVSGSALLDVPVGRTLDGQVLRRSQRIALTPMGNEVDAEISYRLRLAPKESLTLNVLTQFEPGHVKDAPPEAIFGARYWLQF